MPAPDDLDRDRFYASDADDDGDEYELEGPDPEVLAAEERRKAEAIAALERTIDINEIYREVEHSRSSEILNDWVQKLRGGIRFQVKHMLIATAVVAIVLTLWRLELLFTVVVLAVMFSIAGVFLYLQWKEKQHQVEVAARQREMYARRRAAQHSPGAIANAESASRQPASLSPLKDEVDQAWQEAMKRQEFRFQFSLAQMMLAMMGAAVVLGFVNILGAQNAATMLGFIALAGLIAHAIGYQPPPIVALGWWLLLLMYVLLSFFAVIWSSM
jgi:hypothetical protein